MFNAFRKKYDRATPEVQDRIPPGQYLTEKFPVLHYGPVPAFNPAAWDLRVWGEVEEERRWSWDEFNHLPRTRIQMDIHCVTRWSKADTVWEGVSVKGLVEAGLIKIKPTATHVMQHAEYGFTVNLPLEVVLQENVTSTLVNTKGEVAGAVYQIQASFRLIDSKAKKVVFQGASHARAPFERFESIYSNVRAREDAENRAARTISDDLKTRLAAYLSRPEPS